MNDKEKIIKGLECCMKSDDSRCDDCPYNDDSGIGTCDSIQPLFEDTLWLLNKYETEHLINALNDRILVEGPCSLSTLLRAAADHLKKLQEVIDNASINSGRPD